MTVEIKRGELWWVDFEPSLGGEIRKTRPAIIISNNSANRYLNRVQVIPVSSRTDKLYPSEAYITVAGKTSKAMADQIMTASKMRLSKRIGALSALEMEAVERAVRVHLALEKPQ